MPLLLLKDIPQYECLSNAARHYPHMEPGAYEAFLHLLRTADLIAESNKRFSRGHQISQGRFTVLMLLHRPWVKLQSPASLAEAAGVTRATMTGLIDTLEKDGLVTRTHDRQDRRILHIELTAKGRRRIETLIPACFRSITRAMEGLSPKECRELVRLLQKVQERMSAPEAAAEH